MSVVVRRLAQAAGAGQGHSHPRGSTVGKQRNGSFRSACITIIMVSVFALTIFMPLPFVLVLLAPSSQNDAAGIDSKLAARA